MTKADVINEIADKTGIDKSDVQASVEAFFSVVKSNMANGLSCSYSYGGQTAAVILKNPHLESDGLK